MKRYVVLFSASWEPTAILAIAAGEASAHSIAEVISFSRNGNAIYGLFKIRLMSTTELNEADPDGTLLRLFLQD